jgi:hypothetical protein
MIIAYVGRTELALRRLCPAPWSDIVAAYVVLCLYTFNLQTIWLR